MRRRPPERRPGEGERRKETREKTGGGAAHERTAAGEKAGGKAPAGKAIAGNASAGEVPRLSISVDNGRTATQEGDRLTYTVTVRNIGTAGARDLHLTQSLPPGLKFVSADGHGTVRKGQVVWSANLGAGKDVTFHTTAKVQATPDHLLRLATVACASTGADAKPIVCATHSDQLPARRRGRGRPPGDRSGLGPHAVRPDGDRAAGRGGGRNTGRPPRETPRPPAATVLTVPACSWR
ncbi:hypothetical protein ACFQX6_35065 [Streptosporangium lutulentum]